MHAHAWRGRPASSSLSCLFFALASFPIRRRGRFHRVFFPFPIFSRGLFLSPSVYPPRLAEPSRASLCHRESFRVRLRAADYRNQSVPVPVYRPLIIIIDPPDVTSSCFRADRDARLPWIRRIADLRPNGSNGKTVIRLRPFYETCLLARDSLTLCAPGSGQRLRCPRSNYRDTRNVDRHGNRE